MDYTQLFRSLREARGLTLDQLAKLARLHRNTVVNIESGRPVKFKTIARLMQRMGYAANSAELKSMALLWLEAVSGIPFSRTEAESVAIKAISTYRSTARQTTHELDQAVARANLTPEQIRLLIFAARHPAVISIVGSIRELAADLGRDEAGAPRLKAAEDPATDYGKK